MYVHNTFYFSSRRECTNWRVQWRQSISQFHIRIF